MTARSFVAITMIIFASIALVGCYDDNETGATLKGSVTLPEGYQSINLAGVVVTLSKAEHPTPRITTTDQQGDYEFENVGYGTYHVRAELKGDDQRLVGEIKENININSDANVSIYAGSMSLRVEKIIQELTIEFTVVDVNTGSVIPGAAISTNYPGGQGLTASCVGCSTDSNGTYTTSGTTYGEDEPTSVLVVFQITKVGYESQLYEVQTQGLKRELVSVVVALERNSTPFQVGTDNDWLVVENGENHSIALKMDGSLYEWGNYTYSGAGTNEGNHVYRSTPTRVGSGYAWAEIASSVTHNYAIKHDGSLWAWGYDVAGGPVQLDGDHWDSVSTSLLYTMGVKSDGTLWRWGFEWFGLSGWRVEIPKQVGTNSHWKTVAVGGYANHAVALMDNNTLWEWGDKDCGQAGNAGLASVGEPVQVGSDNNWSAVTTAGSLANALSFALKSDGTLWAWGCTDYSSRINVPVQIGTDNDWQVISGNTNIRLIKSDSTLWTWAGWGTDPVQIESDDNWSTVAAGRNHTSAIKADGTLWSWGNDWWDKL